MTRQEVLRWLREENAAALEDLWGRADRTRRQHVGDEVHLRGLVAISNHCVRQCLYCGLRSENASLRRYRMAEPEILACAQQAVRLGYGTIMLQSGEDPGIGPDWLAGVVRRIKQATPLAVTLSLGERSVEELAAWRQAGADRYLLHFETSHRALYDQVHPSAPGRRSDRLALLGELRRLRYQVGSGVMVGLPGQCHEDLASDLELFARLDLDTIAVGPYIPHPRTPMGQPAGPAVPPASPPPGEAPDRPQAPRTEVMACKVLALARLVCPQANILGTAALAAMNPSRGGELGLRRGANVVMPDLTPMPYRRLYETYPGKGQGSDSPEDYHTRLKARLAALGRTPGRGRGDRLRQPVQAV